jgi:protein gp37
MSQVSDIVWTDASWKPATGCTKVSDGCKHCYAETFAEASVGYRVIPTSKALDSRLSPERLELPLRWKKARMIFVNSMSDLFHYEMSPASTGEVFATMERADWHVFQILTKRSARLVELAPELP